MDVQTIEVGFLEVNCYLVTHSDKTLIIDPGDDANKIIKTIEKLSLNPTLCVLTHAHFDHILAVTDILKQYDISLAVNKRDLFLLKEHVDIELLGNRITYIDENTILTLGGLSPQIIETPGHTPGSICLYFEQEMISFVGDLFFAGGYVGRTDFDYGNEAVLYKSIAKIQKLPKGTKFYSGHGPSFFHA